VYEGTKRGIRRMTMKKCGKVWVTLRNT